MKKFYTSLGRLVTMLVASLFFSVAAFAQDQPPITGTVLDEKAEPLQGVSVTIKGSSFGTTTDSLGKFSIRAARGATLVFSYVRYGMQEIKVGSQTSYSIRLSPATSTLNDVVVVGYGSQKKVSLTGAVSSVQASDIVTTKNENVENMLTGKVPGLHIIQNTAEPGDFTNTLSVRGMGNPLIVIDGVQQPDFGVTGGNGDNNVGTSNILSRLDPNDIESVSVLKDASAAVYGVKAANGVILITTKKGRSGTLSLTYTGTYGWQVPSGLPKSVNATQYMTLVNEQSMHNSNGGRITYTPQDFADYANGTKKSTDWYNAVFRKSTPQTQHNITATGGSDNTTYLLSLGYTDQDGLLRSGDLNYKRYNIRSNVTSHITKRITVNLNVSGILDQKNAPAESFWWTTRETWRELPTQTIYANNNPQYPTNGLVDGGNPVVFMDQDLVGYSTQNNSFFNGAISLDYKLPFIEGLSLRGLYSYNTQLQDNKLFQKGFNLYTYDQATNTYTATGNNFPSYVQRQYYKYPKNTDQLSLNYAHSFGDHSVSALILMEGNQQSADNFAAYRQLSIPVDQLIAGNSNLQDASQDNGRTALYEYVTNSFVGRLTYDFRSKYFAEFSFRDDKSSRFAPDQGWGFFPSVSAGWRISEENFWQKNAALSFIDNLKLRASYGVLGDDGQLYYQFITGYNYPANGDNNRLPRGSVFNGSFYNAIQSTGIPNPEVSWSTSHTYDAGIDFDAWKGLLGFSFDYFLRDRKGLLADAALQVPDVLGAPLPQENIRGDRTQGIDFEVNHRNHIGKFNYTIKATFAYSNTHWTNYPMAKQGNSYLDWRNQEAGRNTGVHFGQGAAGQYTSYNQIINSPVYVGRGVVVGDYIYQDWNGDGVIDDNDVHPIIYGGDPNSGPFVNNNTIMATPLMPKISYGLNLGGSYKDFDVNLLFQGTAIFNISYIEQLNIPLWGGGSALTQFLNNYHPADPTADPYNPKTQWVPGTFAYTGTTTDVNSAWSYTNAAYLRLKAAEIGYSIPNKIISRAGIKGVRVFANGYNLLTFTKVKYVDPEHPTGMYGYLYPLDKIFNIGLNVKF